MQSTQLVGVRLDWGEHEPDDSERLEVESILTRTMYMAMGHTTRRVMEQFGREVTVEMETTAI